MARPNEKFEIWIQKERELKEEFMLKNIQKWCQEFPQKCAISATQPIKLGPLSQTAVLTSKQTVTVTTEFYEIIRKKFREYKHQKAHQSKSRLQTRVDPSVVLKLEKIREKLGHTSSSATLELIIENFDEGKIKHLQHIEDLKNKIIEQRDYEVFIERKHKNESNKDQTINSKVQDYLFSQWAETKLKLAILEEHISTLKNIPDLYSSKSEEDKNKLLKKIKLDLNAEFKDTILSIKSTFASSPETHNSPTVTTGFLNQEKSNIPLPIKPSSFSDGIHVNDSFQTIEETPQQIVENDKSSPDILINPMKYFSSQ